MTTERKVYSLSLNANEMRILKAKANKLGMRLGTFIKVAALQYKVPAK